MSVCVGEGGGGGAAVCVFAPPVTDKPPRHWSERTVLTYCRMHGEERKLSVQPALISMADYIQAKQISIAWYGTMAIVLCNHK